mgnify:CR=1 FL=1
MILYANVDDLALIINDVLPKDLFQKVSSYDYENIKNRKRDINHKDWQETLHKDDYKNKTMEQVRTVDSIATYHREKYEFVDVIFKDVLDIIDTGRGLPLCASPVSNSLLVIKNNVQHKVCAVTGSQKRKVLQLRGIFYN